jgi:UPF0755 protein
MKKAAILAAALLLMAMALTFVPASGSDERVEVSIASGASGKSIARSLSKAGVVRSALAFRLACMLSGNSGRLKAGDYEMPLNLNAWQAVDQLVSGKALQRRFLITEGLSAFQIAGLLEAKKLAKGPRFLKLVHDAAFAKQLGIASPSLEGYLFPDSYQFARGIPEETLIGMMVARFKEKVPEKMRDRKILTLASIIEKEARADDERPKVARVFLNRKAQKMRLESCATVRYALNKYQGPILFADLEVASPYNSYRRWGLPPGPICSPGLKAIQAAMHPAEGNWLFFVVGGDGTHVFSETFDEHKKAKARYKRLKKGVVEE